MFQGLRGPSGYPRRLTLEGQNFVPEPRPSTVISPSKLPCLGCQAHGNGPAPFPH